MKSKEFIQAIKDHIKKRVKITMKECMKNEEQLPTTFEDWCKVCQINVTIDHDKTLSTKHNDSGWSDI